MSQNPFKDARVQNFENGAPRRGGGAHDPDGFTVKDTKIRWNAWEHDCIQRLARRECTTIQGLVRSIVRKRLFEEFGR